MFKKFLCNHLSLSATVVFSCINENFRFMKEQFSLFFKVIGMIKGLYGVMLKLENLFSEAAGYYIHAEIQDFIQVTLQEPLRKAAKKAGKALTKS